MTQKRNERYNVSLAEEVATTDGAAIRATDIRMELQSAAAQGGPDAILAKALLRKLRVVDTPTPAALRRELGLTVDQFTAAIQALKMRFA